MAPAWRNFKNIFFTICTWPNRPVGAKNLSRFQFEGKTDVWISQVGCVNKILWFIFRNYAMPFMVTSNYRGSSRFKTWEAVRASSAAPGFFDDFRTQGLVFQDGALIANNPSSVGLHEAKHLWPKEKLQCLVSLKINIFMKVFR